VEGEEREGSDAQRWLQNTLKTLYSTLPFFAGRRRRRRRRRIIIIIIIADGSVGPDFECDGTGGVFVQFCITVMSERTTTETGDQIQFQTIVTSDIYQP
jgi:hypothetical protein